MSVHQGVHTLSSHTTTGVQNVFQPMLVSLQVPGCMHRSLLNAWGPQVIHPPPAGPL